MIRWIKYLETTGENDGGVRRRLRAASCSPYQRYVSGCFEETDCFNRDDIWRGKRQWGSAAEYSRSFPSSFHDVCVP